LNVCSNFDFGNSVSHKASFTKSNGGPRASDNNNYGINNNQPAAMALASASNMGSNKCSKEKVKAVECGSISIGNAEALHRKRGQQLWQATGARTVAASTLVTWPRSAVSCNIFTCLPFQTVK